MTELGETGSSNAQIPAIVVNFNSGSAVQECVSSLRADGVTQILVVDNSSSDGSDDGLRRVDPLTRILKSDRNLGYGAGANLGVSEVEGSFVLICNPDLLVERGALTAMRGRIEADPSIALVGPCLVTSAGKPWASGRRFPGVRRSSVQAFLGAASPGSTYSKRYAEENRRLAASGFADWVTGACLLVRRTAFESIGGFDGEYFMYLEEVDLCWRLKQAGWLVAYESGARVVHLGGLSTARNPYKMIVAHHRSLWRFSKKTLQKRERWMLPLVAVGIILRWAIVSARQFALRLRA